MTYKVSMVILYRGQRSSCQYSCYEDVFGIDKKRV